MDKEKTAGHKSKLFAVRIVKMCRHLMKEKHEQVLSKQVLRSGTSIGANLAESENAVSRSDFRNKIYIALKECNETLYWIDILYMSDYLNQEEYHSIHNDCEELKKMLQATTKTLNNDND